MQNIMSFAVSWLLIITPLATRLVLKQYIRMSIRPLFPQVSFTRPTLPRSLTMTSLLVPDNSPFTYFTDAIICDNFRIIPSSVCKPVQISPESDPKISQFLDTHFPEVKRSSCEVSMTTLTEPLSVKIGNITYISDCRKTLEDTVARENDPITFPYVCILAGCSLSYFVGFAYSFFTFMIN